MPTSVRLDANTERVVRSLARRTGRPRSQVIRDAIRRLAAAEPETREEHVVFEIWRDAIGCANLADASLVAMMERDDVNRGFTLDQRDFAVHRSAKPGRFSIIP